ncbi:DUF917 domain-containing protein [Caldisphaera lagunensis]|nr:DUF917 domain-containing protein [Caldisphaera lagunensis]
MLKLSNIEDAKKLVLGASFLATGGGGNPNQGLKMLSKALDHGPIEIIDVEDLPENTIIGVPYFVGSVSSKEKDFSEDIIIETVNTLESIVGKKISALAASEIGGGNTPIVFYIASRLGVPVIDGDFIGRAAPELDQSTANVMGYPLYPSVISTNDGDLVIVKKYANTSHYEHIARQISVAGDNSAFVIDTPLSSIETKKSIVRKTISLSIKIGEKIYEAKNKKLDPIDEVVKLTNGFKILRGEITDYHLEEKEGFLIGEVTVKGQFKNKEIIAKSWIKNEHILLKVNDKPAVFPPDLIIFARDDGTPLLNYEIEKGIVVNIVSIRAPEIWRTKKGLEIFGPRHFGFDYDYIPVEELINHF